VIWRHIDAPTVMRILFVSDGTNANHCMAVNTGAVCVLLVASVGGYDENRTRHLRIALCRCILRNGVRSWDSGSEPNRTDSTRR